LCLSPVTLFLLMVSLIITANGWMGGKLVVEETGRMTTVLLS
jgi:hypothetical protein